MQTFIKTMNYTHLMPTRYNLSDVDLKKVVASDALENSEKKLAANKVLAPAMNLPTDLVCMHADHRQPRSFSCCSVAGAGSKGVAAREVQNW